MNLPGRFFAAPALHCVLAAACLAGCSVLPKNPASVTADKSFISYWPPQEGKGLRVAVKDLIDMKGEITTAGSQHFVKTRPPATQDAPLLRNARRQNVQFVGKTNLTEFAITVSGINDFYGTPENPLDRSQRIPGGSSSGSATAVANGLADVALGTDTAGSIRVPAACTGIVGLKTTFGLVPLKGVYPISPEFLDTVGPMARDIQGTVRGMELLQSGFRSRYERARAVKPTGAQIRVGRLYLKNTNPAIDRAIDEALERAGFQIVRLDDVFRERWEEADRDAKRVAAVNAWLTNRHFAAKLTVTTRTKAAIALGALAYDATYPATLSRRLPWQATLRRALADVDLIALPTLQQLPPKIPLIGRSATLEARVFAMQNTAAVNFAGNPAIALPVPLSDRGVPVTSLQLIGPWYGEAAVLNAGRLVEEAVNPIRATNVSQARR